MTKYTPEAAAYLEREWCAGASVKIITVELNRMLGASLTRKQVGYTAHSRGLERPRGFPTGRHRKLSEGQAFLRSYERATVPRRPADRVVKSVVRYPVTGFSMLGGTVIHPRDPLYPQLERSVESDDVRYVKEPKRRNPEHAS